MNEPIDGLTEGRIVHYVLANGEHRPAVIVKVWDKHAGTSNLVVFMDGQNDEQTGDNNRNTQWQTSVVYSEAKEPGTWHWIEKL